VLAPYAGRNCLTARAATMWGPVDSFLGRLAATAGRFDDAEAHFRAGIEAADRVNARTSEVRTRWWYAQMLRKRNADGDEQRAVELKDAALAVARELGVALDAVGEADESVQERA
jgi:hypothetical protein